MRNREKRPGAALQEARGAAGRDPSLDALRVLAAFFVIVNHTAILIFRWSPVSPGWWISLAWYFVSKPAVPVFLMLTGALFLDREPDWPQARRRALRILVVLAASNLFYYGYHLLTKPGMQLSVKGLASALLDKEIDTLWYLDLYLGCMLMLPFLQKLARSLSRREEEWLILLSVGVLGCLIMLQRFVPGVRWAASFKVPLLPTYLGFVFLGHYLYRVRSAPEPRRTLPLCALIFAAVLAIELWATYRLYGKDQENYLAMDNREYLTVSVRSVCVFLSALSLRPWLSRRPRLCRALSALAALAFGIFLLGDLAIDLTRPVYVALGGTHREWTVSTGPLPRNAALLLWELLIFALSAAATWLLRRVRPLRRFL